MSSARLAAEAAFSAPPQNPPPSGQAPRIIVRRGRTVTPPAETAGEAQAAVDEPRDKAPRVFRLAAAARPTLPTLPTLPIAAPAASPGADNSNLPTAAAGTARQGRRKGNRRDRIGSHARPGPVVQIVSPPQAAVPGHGRGLVIMDDSFAADWERLAQQARRIQRDIEAALRKRA